MLQSSASHPHQARVPPVARLSSSRLHSSRAADRSRRLEKGPPSIAASVPRLSGMHVSTNAVEKGDDDAAPRKANQARPKQLEHAWEPRSANRSSLNGPIRGPRCHGQQTRRTDHTTENGRQSALSSNAGQPVAWPPPAGRRQSTGPTQNAGVSRRDRPLLCATLRAG